MTERERRAYNKALEAAAKMADLFADENIRMAHDSLLADPILCGSRPKNHRDLATAVKKSERLQVDGCVHSSMFHAGEMLAKTIRGMKVGA